AEDVERAGKPVGHVGKLGGQAKRPALAGATNQDLRAARLDRARLVERPLDSIVLAREARPVLGEHQVADGERLAESVHPLADGRKLEAVAPVLGLVPGCADAQDGPTPAG